METMSQLVTEEVAAAPQAAVASAPEEAAGATSAAEGATTPAAEGVTAKGGRKRKGAASSSGPRLSFNDELEEEEQASEGTHSTIGSLTAERFELEARASSSRRGAPRTSAEPQHPPASSAEASVEPPPPADRQPLLVHATAQSRGARPYQEDRHVWVEDLGSLASRLHGATFACVLDGHGGSRCADFAAVELHRRLAADEALHAGAAPAVVAGCFERCFAAADRDFLERARLDSLGDGTTVLCALLEPAERSIHVANLGDTRCVLGRLPLQHGEAAKDGECAAVRLSVDHKPNLPEEARRVRGAGGSVRCLQGCWRVLGGAGCTTTLAISRALGDRALKPIVSCEPSTTSLRLTPRDQFVVLASDGLWDVLTDEQAVALAWETAALVTAETRAARPQAVADALMQRALKLGSADNITVLVVWLLWGS